MNSTKYLKKVISLVSVLAFTIIAFGVNPTATMAQDAEKVHTVVDEMPEIIGGLPALYKEIDYPREAVKKNISGRVYLQVIVNTDGKAENPKVIRDIGGGCGEAAAEGITKVDFKPGKQDGKKVKVKYSLPVTFRIDK
ncbi:MAG: energy transducer TonB [Candidatus Dadabacteria bacterium]|nr:energy transducer TonB [Candidatus Dadabacteria bacterium]NIV16233.1 TonB family protein [Fodinibius sp.]